MEVDKLQQSAIILASSKPAADSLQRMLADARIDFWPIPAVLAAIFAFSLLSEWLRRKLSVRRGL